MADAFYAKQSKTCQEFVWDLPRFLINDLVGHTGPAANPWTIIDTYSSGAGTPHEVPGDATDMDSLAADNAWRTGATDLVVGDYIIVKSGSAANPFIVGIEWQATDQIKLILDYKAGFSTVADNNDMTTAGNWATTTSATVTFDPNNVAVAGNYSIVADRDRFMLFYEDGDVNHMAFTYVGKYDDAMSIDEYNSVIYTQCNTVGITAGAGMGDALSFDKLSVVDDSTNLSCIGGTHTFDSSDAATLVNFAQNQVNSEWRFYDVLLATNTAGHYGTWGKLRGCYYTNENIVATGQTTLDTMAYLAFGDTASYGKVVINWDGATAY